MVPFESPPSHDVGDRISFLVSFPVLTSVRWCVVLHPQFGERPASILHAVGLLSHFGFWRLLLGRDLGRRVDRRWGREEVGDCVGLRRRPLSKSDNVECA